MAQTFAQKVLARTSGKSDVRPGEIVDAYPDLVMSHTASWRCIKQWERIGIKRFYDVDRLAFVLDHTAPAYTPQISGYHALVRDFAREHGIKKFYDVSEGIAHIVLMERGHVKPGMLIVGTDSHSTIYGALGALGTGIGFSEITAIWITGKLWMKVPDSMKIVLDGSFRPGVFAKDLMLKLVGDLTANGATYLSVEYGGSLLGRLSVSERMTMANLTMEMGCKNGYVPPDDITLAYLREHGAEEVQPVFPDGDATYLREVKVNVDELEPQIACPHEVENVRPISEVSGTKVNQVFIGSCANAKYEDLVEAAKVLKGRRVNPSIRLIVTPASRMVLLDAMRSDVLETLVEAGALIQNPGCGACAGDGGVLSENEVCLSTANRNFVGRMGPRTSSIYLGSPATAAATAITGVITDPREFVQGRM
ncbi:MAG: 3-isopropylmalate dehydratase large subunit [Chloroflexota bacterium]|nr:3-isopropylmalate dehydratase large subunit [Chloroflexota bacterium]